MPTQTGNLFKIKTPLASLYLFYGSQQYMLNQLKNQVLELSLSKEERDFNFSIYDMEETPVENAIEDAETLPFMGDKRVVLIQNPYFLTGEKAKNKVEHDLSTLEGYINNPSPDTILIIMAPYEQLDKRKKVVKYLLDKAEVYERSKMNEKEMYTHLSELAQESDVSLEYDAFERMLALIGPKLSDLVNEVEKMALFCGEGGMITQSVVESMASKSLESNVFTLIDDIMNKRLRQAFSLLADLLKLKEEPIRILALISRQFRIVYQVSIYRRQGFGQKQIAGLLKLHPFSVKIAMEQAASFSESALRKALDLCTETDYTMKTGQMDKDVALELLIHQLAMLHK